MIRLWIAQHETPAGMMTAIGNTEQEARKLLRRSWLQLCGHEGEDRLSPTRAS